jgi:hypothetical protein
MIDEFSVGQQPCDSFTPEHAESFSLASYPLCGIAGCSARTSFCVCCAELHHAGGLDACPTSKTTLQQLPIRSIPPAHKVPRWEPACMDPDELAEYQAGRIGACSDCLAPFRRARMAEGRCNRPGADRPGGRPVSSFSRRNVRRRERAATMVNSALRRTS